MAISVISNTVQHWGSQAWNGAATVVHKAEDVTHVAVHEVDHGFHKLWYNLAGPPADAPLSPAAQDILRKEGVQSARQVVEPADRSQIAWDALKANQGGPSDLKEGKNPDLATAWTYGQTMTAALDQARLTGNYDDFDKLSKNLEKYKVEGGGYAPDTNSVHGTGDRYFDDNAWIGLSYMQAYQQVKDPQKKAQYLAEADSVFNFLKTGQQSDGGLIWKENEAHPSYNTCAEGPAAELAFQLHLATAQDPRDTNTPYFKFGKQVYDHMQDHLLIKDGPNAGLYADNVGVGSSQRDGAIRSYNQGTPIGASTLLYRITGDKQYLEQAQHTADSSMAYYCQDDRLWKEAPAFNAIYLRNLLQLDGVAPDPDYHHFIDGYANRVWNDSLNPESGLFNGRPSQPMGNYGGKAGDISTLDQAALVQIFSIQGWAPSWSGQLT